jgi:hypothetical protein
MLSLNGVKDVSSIELSWMGQTEAISIEKISLINEPAQRSEPVSPLSLMNSLWRYVADMGQARVYENLRASPRAWLVPEVLSLKAEEVFQAIKTSKLPDGRVYDPARLALVEEPSPLLAQAADPAATARVAQISDTEMEVRTSSASPSFLVTSDVHYPGWHATLDGAPVQLFRANYVLRGVQVPAGEHVVRFEFRPKTFYYGAAVSLLSLLILLGFLLIPVIRRGDVKSQLLS